MTYTDLVITEPTVGADVDTWGTELNLALTQIVTALNGVGHAVDAVGGVPGGALLATNNLSDLTAAITARANLGLGSAAVQAATAFDAAGAANAAQVAAAADATTKVAVETTARIAADALLAAKAANLGDLASAATARTNLGLGGAAVLGVGTTAGTVAAGDDSRFGGGGTPDATVVTYDPSASAGWVEENALVEGMPVHRNIVGTTVARALDYLNRAYNEADHMWYLLGQRDSLRRMYPLVGSSPSTATGEFIPGIAPNGSRQDNSGAALTLQPATQYPMQEVTLTANTTLTLPEAAIGAELTAVIVQDGTGSRTLAWAAGTGQSLKWPTATAPTVIATAASSDVFKFICTAAKVWRGYRPATDVR